MISNERQYRITKAHAEKFSRALQEATAHSGVDPLLEKLERDALSSQLHDLEQELQEYEMLRSGEESVLTLDSFAELPHALIKARVASGLTQKDLADRLGLKEQQIQRYEATDYTAASVRRLKQVIEALDIRVHADVFLGAPKAAR
ncbi:MAG: helix-turn-helix transcriptional regulator [Planctomycetota bacterium]